MNKRRFSGTVLIAGILVIVQYFMAFFVFKLPGLKTIQVLGWAIWVIALYFGIAPIFILRRHGGVDDGKSYVQTTSLVDSGLYAVVRHPQYLSFILTSLAFVLLAQHWVIFGLGILSTALVYLAILDADQEGIEQFGDGYRDYMHRVPRANLLLGLFRLVRQKVKKSQGVYREL